MVEAIEQSEKQINRQSGGDVASAAFPKRPATDAFEPQHQQQKQRPSQKIQARREAGQQIEAERSRANQQRAPAAAAQPLVLIREAGHAQQEDVVVLHHVLRVMEMGGRQQQSQNTHHRLRDAEIQLPQKAEANQRSQHRHQDVNAVADDDVAHAGIGVVILGKDWETCDVGANHIRRQQDQGLTEAIPTLELSPAAMYTEFWELIGKHLWFPRPPGVSRLQAMGCIGRAQLSRLHHECDQTSSQGKEKERITEPAAKIHYSHYGLMRLPAREIASAVGCR